MAARINRFRPLLRLILCAVTAVLLGLSGHADAKPFRLVVTETTTPLVPNSVMDLAQQLGYFEREGVDVTIVHVQQTPLAIAALTSGQGDMANISVRALLQLVGRRHAPLKAVVSPNKSIPFLIAARKRIDSLSQLQHGRFGVGRVGSLDYDLSRAVMRSKGVDPDTVQMVSLGQPHTRAQALVAGGVDATAMSIGSWTAIPDKSDLHVLVPTKDYFAAAPVVSKVNVVFDQALRERRAEVIRVVTAIIKASRDFARDPDKWIAAMRIARPDVKPAVLRELAEAYRESWSVDGGLDRQELAYTARWMWRSPDFSQLPALSLADWIDFSVVDRALARIGRAARLTPPAAGAE